MGEENVVQIYSGVLLGYKEWCDLPENRWSWRSSHEVTHIKLRETSCFLSYKESKFNSLSPSIEMSHTHTYVYIYVYIWHEKNRRGLFQEKEIEVNKAEDKVMGMEGRNLYHIPLLSRLCLPVCSSTRLMSEWRALSRRRKETSGKCRVAREGNRDKEKWSTMTRAYENVIKKHNSLDVD